MTVLTEIREILDCSSDNSRNSVTARCTLILDKFKNVDEATAAEPIKNLIKTTKPFATQLNKPKLHDTSVGIEQNI